jgi:DNA polymerase-3 subunit alpha/error-prone DNA polymerase
VSLVAAGAFDGIAGGLPRTSQARALLCAVASGSGAPGADGASQGLLFGEPGRAPPVARAGLSAGPGPAGLPASRTDRELHDEFGTLGFLRDRHPLALWSQAVAYVDRILAQDISRYVGRQITLVGWPVTQKEVLTSGGLVMDFVSLEDETALYETVLFPETYARCSRLLFEARPLVVRGLVCDDQGAVSVEVRSLSPLTGD